MSVARDLHDVSNRLGDAGAKGWPMTMINARLQELEQDARTARRALERVPGDKLAWKPTVATHQRWAV
jgi:hypothetical protein